MICRKGIVRGKVQGVCFRAFVKAEAEKHSVDGYAMNLRDGSVEVLLCGDPDNIQSVEKALRSGPPNARVDEVNILDEACTQLAGFRIL